MVNLILVVVGIYIILEAIIAIIWPYNDKTILGAMARGARLVAGGLIVAIGILE